MSLLTELTEKCPLSCGDLEGFLKAAAGMLDKCRTYVIDSVALFNKNEGSVVDDIMSNAEFNELFEAIRRGDTLKIVVQDKLYMISEASVSEIASDGYRTIEYEVYGTFDRTAKRLKIGLEMLGGSIRLYEKTLQTIV